MAEIGYACGLLGWIRRGYAAKICKDIAFEEATFGTAGGYAVSFGGWNAFLVEELGNRGVEGVGLLRRLARGRGWRFRLRRS